MLTSIVGINWGDEGKGRILALQSNNSTNLEVSISGAID